MTTISNYKRIIIFGSPGSGKSTLALRLSSQLNIPVYLDQDVESWFAEKARIKEVELQSLINELLRKDISLIQEVTGKN